MELIMGINGINHGLSKITQITVGNSMTELRSNEVKFEKWHVWKYSFLKKNVAKLLSPLL